MEPIRQWLDRIGLAQYGTVFVENDIDLEALRLLGENDLEKLAVSLGHRKKILKAISEIGTELISAAALPPSDSRPPTAVDSERRQLTVLFCDMVGFTE